MQDISYNENQIEGKNAILEAFNSGRGIKKIYIAKNLRDDKINKLIDSVKKTGTIINFVDKPAIDKISQIKSNQGIVAIVDDFQFVEVEDILKVAEEKNEPPFILLLDEIEDPHNFGAIIRTAECVGVHGIIIKNRNQVSITATVASVSSGACNYMKIARVNNLSKTINELKEKNMWFACADMKGNEMTKTNLTGAIGIVLGNEGSGVSRLVKEQCDFNIKIPMKGHIDSLNVSVAAGVIMYEVFRQRGI